MKPVSRWFGALRRADDASAVAGSNAGPAFAFDLNPSDDRLRSRDGGRRRFHRLRGEAGLVVAIGDVHGRLDLLHALEGKLDRLTRSKEGRVVEIYLGDYVDFAGDSRAVLDHLVERAGRSDRETICLAGNHERMLMWGLGDLASFRRWLRFGGESTIRSYGVDVLSADREPQRAQAEFRAAFPSRHRQFLESLPTSFAYDEFFFVHAGVNPIKPLSRQAEEDLLWIREPFLSSVADFGKVVVHGHTPSAAPELRRNRIGIDTGAYLTGRLTGVVITPEGFETVATGGRGA